MPHKQITCQKQKLHVKNSLHAKIVVEKSIYPYSEAVCMLFDLRQV